MKNKMNQKWDIVIKSFEEKNPTIIDRVVDWYPIGPQEIVVVLDTGMKYAYYMFSDGLRIIRDSDEYSCENEEDWRKMFANRLCERMRKKCIAQYELAEQTGITTVTISKYMNGRATPSGYNLERLANALTCSVTELI